MRRIAELRSCSVPGVLFGDVDSDLCRSETLSIQRKLAETPG